MPDRIVRHNGIPEHSRVCNCLDCRAAWEPLDLQAVELRHARPATDAEWRAFMNGEFPRAKEGVSRG